MSNLFVLDGSWYVFRAYYWLPELTDKDWHNVNAIFWFFRMLFRLWQKKPDSFVIARDSPKKTIRKEKNENYKANRVKMPDDFKRQMRMIKDLVEQLGIPALECPWYEADDIIWSIVEQKTQTYIPGTGVTIVSSDKDLKQLLREWVKQFDAMKNITTTEKMFIEEYWFKPIEMIDYLSLLWDASDNIPWVMGIGKKWAWQLVSTYGNLDAIYDNLDALSDSVRQKLENWKESAYSSREMVQLMDVPDVSVEGQEEGWKCDYDFDTMKSVLVDTYEFASLWKVIEELKKQWQWGEQLSLFW